MVISILTPVYNVERYLRRCVNSIVNQSFKDFELILIDDGSPDQSGIICDQYADSDDRIRVIHQENGGAASARNAGLAAARGEWITFIDSDDWVHKDYLKVLLNTAIQEGADIVACKYDVVSNTKNENDHTEIAALSGESVDDYWVGDRTGATVPWGKLYRRELFEGVQYPNGRTAEDEYVTYKLLFGCKHLIVLENKLYHYYVNNNSVSHSDYLKRMPDALEAFRQHEEYFIHSNWQNVYRLEVEYHAAAWSDAIWILKKRKDKDSHRIAAQLRHELREYMSTHKRFIPFEKRKDIYISAYPSQTLLIRCLGFLKKKLYHY